VKDKFKLAKHKEEVMKRRETLMFRTARMWSIAAVSFVFLGGMSTVASAQSNVVTRTIDLVAVENCSRCGNTKVEINTPSFARITMQIFGDPSGNPEIHLTVQGLQAFVFDGAYALYFSVDPDLTSNHHSPNRRIFNVNFPDRTEVWGALPGDIPFDSPSITAFIVEEPDDGLSFDGTVDMDKVQMVGTSFK